MKANESNRGISSHHFGSRRIISWILAIAMIFSLIPSSLLFADEEPAGDAVIAEYGDEGGEEAVIVSADDEDGLPEEAESVAEEDLDSAELEEDINDEGFDEDLEDLDEDPVDLNEDELLPDDDDGDADEPSESDETAILGIEDELIITPFAVTHLVSFLIEGETYLIALVDDGGTAKFPGSPPKDKFPPGFVSFIGWFEAGATTPFDFMTPIYNNLTLNARFSEKYLVQFLDGFDEVFKSTEVAQGSAVPEPTAAEIDGIPLPQDKFFSYWTLDKKTEIPYNFSTIITDDIKLYPVFTDRVFVYFISYSEEVNPYPEGIKAGERISAPPTPSRDKYTFNYWTLNSDGSGPAYDWNTPVTKDIVLYASWTGIPNSAQYKIAYWLERPDFGSGEPTPGLASDYIFADIVEDQYGTPGEYVYITDLSNLPAAASRGINDPMRYAEYQTSAPTIISAADNTIINVYVKRIVYNFTFDLDAPGRSFRFNGTSTQYSNANPYVMSVKYQQNCSDLWPCSATAVFNFNFWSWIPPKTLNVYNENSLQYFLTRRNIISSDMMPVNPAMTSGHAYKAVADEVGEYHARYYIEAYDGQTYAAGEYRNYPWGSSNVYVIDGQYNQDNVPVLTNKAIVGLTAKGVDVSATEMSIGLSSVHPSIQYQYPYINLYYTRNRHVMSFEGVPQSGQYASRTLMFGQPLAAYKPADPVKTGYTFKGWYKDADFTLEFDFNNETMPPETDLVIFAKWESKDNKVRFWDGSNYLGEHGVAMGEPVNFNNLWFGGLLYDTNLKVTGKGWFLGWLYDPLGTGLLVPFPVDLLLYHDLDLYANWNASGFQVEYMIGNAAPGSSVPVDPNYYSIGALARMLPGNMISPVANQGFIGWRFKSAGMTYYPGSFISVVDDMDMYPYFVNYNDITQIIYDNNLSGATHETVSVNVEKNTLVPLTDESIFTKLSDTSTMIGWSVNPGGPKQYDKNSVYNMGPNPITLYAIWETNMVNLTYDGNDATNFTTLTVPVPRNASYDVVGNAPANVERIGRNLLGWSTERNNPATRITSNIFISNSITVYALWSATPVYVKLTFMGNGNDEGAAVTEVDVLIHDTVNLNNAGPKNLIKYGYDFIGWSKELMKPQTQLTTLKIDADETVFAIWSDGPAQYINLTFDGNGDNDTTTYAVPGGILKHMPVTLADYAPSVVKSGYNLGGWSLVKDVESSIITVIDRLTADTTVFAYWIKGQNVNLIFDGNGGKNAANATEFSVEVQINSTQILADREPKGDDMFKRAGYSFRGWSATAAGATPLSTVNIVDADVRVFAIWEKVANVNLIFNGNGGFNAALGSSYAVPGGVEVNSTQPLAPLAPTGDEVFKKPGYYQIGWSTKPDDPSSLVTSVNILESDVNVYALWNDGPPTYVNLKFNGNTGANISGIDPVGVPVLINSTVTLAALQPSGIDAFTKVGFDLYGWADSATGTIALTTIDIGMSDVNVYAIWESGADVVLTFIGNGGVNEKNETAYSIDVPRNSVQTLASVQPTGDDMFTNPGFVFTGWTNLPNGVNPILTVNVGTTGAQVYAMWEPRANVNLVFDGNGGRNEYGNTIFTVPGGVLVNSTQILANVAPVGPYMFTKEGSVFGGWSTTADGLNPVTSVKILLSNVRVYAIWNETADVKLIFNGNGAVNGNNADSYEVSVKVNSTYALSVVQPTGVNMFTRPGYNFVGWSLSAVSDDQVFTVNIQTTNLAVYAIWEEGPKVNLTFVGNGGYNDFGSNRFDVSVDRNSTVTLADVEPKGEYMFKRPGYKFVGWAATSSGVPSPTLQVYYYNAIAYAIWQKIDNVNIIYHGNGGEDRSGNTTFSAGVPANSVQYLFAYEPSGNAAFRRAGYIQRGWASSSTGTVEIYSVNVGESDVDVYAIWEYVGNVRLTFRGNGGINRYGEIQYAVDVPVYSTQQLATHAPTGNDMFRNAGYNFIGWSDTATGRTPITEIEIYYYNAVVYAIWEKGDDVKLKFYGNGGVSASGLDPYEAGVPINSTQVLANKEPADANRFFKTGHYFGGWADTPTGKIPLSTVDIETSDVSVYAIWIQADLVVLTFYGNGGINKLGGMFYDVPVPIYSTQTVADLEPKAANDIFKRPGYNLAGWSLTAGGAALSTVDIYYYNVILYAVWEEGENVDLIFNGNEGLDKNNNATYKVPGGVKINSTQSITTLQPTGDAQFKRPGYVLIGWSTVRNDLTTRVLSVDIGVADVEVYALWYYFGNTTLTYYANGGMSKNGAMYHDVSVPINSTQILANNEPTGNDRFIREGYKLVGWSLTNGGPVIDRVDILLDPVTVYAVWVVGEKVDLVFEGNGGVNLAGNSTFTVQVSINTIQALSPIAPSGNNMFYKSGCKFLGWTTVPNDAATLVTTVEIIYDDVTVYALWDNGGNKVNLTFNGNGGVSLAGNSTYTAAVPINTLLTLADHEPKGVELFRIPGMVLSGWSQTPSGAVITTLFIYENPLTVYAIWVKSDPTESDTPTINPIKVTDDKITGEGVPGAKIVITWPNGDKSDPVTVDEDGNWSIDVPDDITLKIGDIITAVQTEDGKLPSLPAQETVGGDTVPNDEISDTPDINPIYEGDKFVTGRGTPGSKIVVAFPNGDKVPTTVNNDGIWSVPVPAGLDLAVGDEVFAQQTTDPKLPSEWAKATVRAKPDPNISDTPIINKITEGDDEITGKGIPGSTIVVTWPDGTTTDNIVVGPDGNWKVDVPDDMELKEGDVITAVQIEDGKLPSKPAQETVGGDTVPNDEESDTPDITIIYEGDRVVKGRGTPGSKIEVWFPDGSYAVTTVRPDETWSVDVPAGLDLEIGDIVDARQTTSPKLPSKLAKSTVRERPISAQPTVNVIREEDWRVTGTGIPGSQIIITWPDGTVEAPVIVGNDNRWTVYVPMEIYLALGETVKVVQVEVDKKPSPPVNVLVQQKIIYA